MEVLLLLLSSTLQCSTLGAAHTVMALVGENVTLSYSLKQSTDPPAKTMECNRMKNMERSRVHLHENGRENSRRQDPAYRGRTGMSAELEKGIASLTLRHVRLSDEGNYTCFFSSTESRTIQLLIGAASSPVITLERANISILLLSCQSAGWYPQPQLSWRDSEGRPLSPAAMPTTTRDSNGLYNISSTVMVEKGRSGRLTCRVHQEQFNQTRETEIPLPDILFPVQRGHICWWVIGLLILLVVMGIGYRKMKTCLLGCGH